MGHPGGHARSRSRRHHRSLPPRAAAGRGRHARDLLLRGAHGGAEGLAAFLRTEGITHVIDATHPFAATMSRNAIAACAATATPLLALERAAWPAEPGWTHAADAAAAAAALPDVPQRVFLAIGRQSLPAFAGLPHRWLMRVTDDAPVPLPGRVIVARGPFDAASETDLLRAEGTQILVTKNAGGPDGKLAAARALGVAVVMIDRPALPARARVATPEAALDWLHGATPRGV